MNLMDISHITYHISYTTYHIETKLMPSFLDITRLCSVPATPTRAAQQPDCANFGFSYTNVPNIPVVAIVAICVAASVTLGGYKKHLLHSCRRSSRQSTLGASKTLPTKPPKPHK